tara:strand:+ start:685 stop:951 length:267 start_codon:yes stop_codon:yes gene_type:complete
MPESNRDYHNVNNREATEAAINRAPPKYPVIVQLTGTDGNAFALMGRVDRALRKAGADAAERESFMTEAMAGDYDNLLRVCMAWVDAR